MTVKSLFATAAAIGVLATASLVAQQINGAGATFPDPIYQKWFAEYNRLKPEVRINYQPQGSGAGIKQVTSRTVFFGATDGPMTPEQLQAAPGRILHFPTVLGAVVPIYNIPGVTAELKFTGTLIADIYLGKITKWNDPAIAKLNAGVNLPNTDIVVVRRADGSGTTYIFVDYLAKVSPEWKKRVGVNTAVNWPTGVGAKGNDGVTGQVKQVPGAIGYVELTFALSNKLSYGAVQNAAGQFVRASTESVTAAADAAAKEMPADFRVSITNPPGNTAYPIASFTWLLLYEDAQDKKQAATMVEFMKWALTDGQKFASQMGYAPLPKTVIDLEMKALQKIKVK
ncbi:MAG TPA: phosphate ABC transporter substrate-binding protein PstS [Vicinamibacterales bacterium]|jgi:phosphate transport system substrate-binding protein